MSVMAKMAITHQYISTANSHQGKWEAVGLDVLLLPQYWECTDVELLTWTRESKDSWVRPGLASQSPTLKLLCQTRKSTGTRESKAGESTSPNSWTRSSSSTEAHSFPLESGTLFNSYKILLVVIQLSTCVSSLIFYEIRQPLIMKSVALLFPVVILLITLC